MEDVVDLVSNADGLKSMITVKIENIAILLTRGTDKVLLFTNLSSPILCETGNLVPQFDATYNTAQNYVANNFPDIPVTVINGR